jgi:hypothetical protein
MTEARVGTAAVLAHTDEPRELEPELTAGNISARCEKSPIWRFESEPRRMVEERRAFVSALAHGGE